MFSEELEMYLIGQKMLPVKLNTDILSVLYTAELDVVKAVMIYNSVDNECVFEEKHRHIREQVVNMLSEKHKIPVNTMAVICTEAPQDVEEVVANSAVSDERWIVNTKTNTVVLGDGQHIFNDNIYKYVEDVIKAESYRHAYVTNDKSAFVKAPTVNDVKYKRAAAKGRSIGNSSFFRNYIFTVTTALIIINFVVYFDLEKTGSTYSPFFMLKHGAMYWENLFDKGEVWRLLTSMFMHFGIDHLIGNMVVMFLLGNALEQSVGKIRFLIIYIGSGLTGGLVSGIYQWSIEGNAVCAGASGAIYGIMGAMIIVFWVCKIRTSISLRGLILYSIVSIVNSMNAEGVDHSAHMGGFTSGMILAIILLLVLSNDRIQGRGSERH